MRRIGYVLLLADALLGAAHLLFPEFMWGQGRKSYFNFHNNLTLASWLASMQMVVLSGLCLAAFHRKAREATNEEAENRWFWCVAAVLGLGLSFLELTRAHVRLEVLGFPSPDPYQRLVAFGGLGALLLLFGWFVLAKVKYSRIGFLFGVLWIVTWGGALLLGAADPFPWPLSRLAYDLLKGLLQLFGCTFAILTLDVYLLSGHRALSTRAAAREEPSGEVFGDRTPRAWMLTGVAGTTLIVVSLQIVLFQLLTIGADYMTANTVISIAVIGISVGGLIGSSVAGRRPIERMAGIALLGPLFMLVSFGAAVSLTDTPLVASWLMMLPFISSGAVITIALTRAASHLVYFVDLLGAAAGAILISPLLSQFREEGCMLFLTALSFLVVGAFAKAHPSPRFQLRMMVPVATGVLFFLAAVQYNLRLDHLNVVRTTIREELPSAEVLLSRSSLVGRYDIVRRTPTSDTLKAYENGRVIDTIRSKTQDDYHIDPRVPHTLIDDPSILILGLSGDAITKTAKHLTKEVYGVEINPAVVEVQSRELKDLNGDAYENIDVAVMDGRSYVAERDRKYDMITMLNAHFAKGSTSGRSASPEYLHTLEAMKAYLDRLTDRGVVIIEEPVGRPSREPPVWKMVGTMRQALIEYGATRPEAHFFIFQWKTRRNNYIQILMKRRPFTDLDLANLREWLRQVDDIRKIERRENRWMGPIKATTTLLYAPDTANSNVYTRLVAGDLPDHFVRAHHLATITDDRPYPFDVSPSRSEAKASFVRTSLMALLLLPFFLASLWRRSSELRRAVPYLGVVALTGLAYLLIEVVLIQRFQIFLGSPALTLASILGGLLFFSGLGSLWSGRTTARGVRWALAGLFAMLGLHHTGVPWLLPLATGLTLPAKVLVTVACVAPLAFFMGVPFPYVLRSAKSQLTDTAPAILFAVNAASSALAVPLALNLATEWGMKAVFVVSVALYAAVAISLYATLSRRAPLLAGGSGLLILFVALASPWFGERGLASGLVDSEALPRVYAISYGQARFRESLAFHDGSRSRRIKAEWLFYLIQAGERTILVDTGFHDRDLGEQWDTTGFVSPLERLAQLEISPDDVTDVILTHLHWDHAGGLDAFGNARIWLQKAEYEHAVSVVGSSTARASGVHGADLFALRRAEIDGRLSLVDDTYPLLPGITMAHNGSHTPGSQHVTVDTVAGVVVISGDANYFYLNSQKHLAIGGGADEEKSLRTTRELQSQASSPFFVLPGHDPRVMRWFPEVSDGIVSITTVAE